MPDFTTQAVAMIGIGVGIDYALLIVTRYRQALRDGHQPESAVALAADTAGRSVVFAGTTVVIAVLGMLLIQVPAVQGLAVGIALGVLMTMLAAVTLLPALLSILGQRIESLRVPFLKQHPHDHRPHGWARWARGVGRHPLPAIVVAVSILVVLAIPILNLELGQQDNGQLAKSTTVREAYDLLSKGFGPGVNGPFLIAVDFDGSSAHPDQKQLNQLKREQQQQQQQAVAQATQQLEAEGVPPDEAQSLAEQEVASQPPSKKQKQAAQQEAFLKTTASDPRLVKLENKISKTKGVKDVSPAKVDKTGKAAVFTVTPTTAPSATATEDLVRKLRSTVVPRALDGTDLQAYVGGQTAGYIDLADRISDRLARVIAVVIALSFVLLLIAFRSIWCR
jgi:RND superfamily putative drug exporter